MLNHRPNYDRFPVIQVPGDHQLWRGWESVGRALAARAGSGVTVIDCYPGVDGEELLAALRVALQPPRIIATADLLRSPEELDRLLAPWLGGDDPVFGALCHLELEALFDPARLAAARAQAAAGGPLLVWGVGAALVHRGDTLVLADLARWEIQQRQRRGSCPNLGAANAGDRPALLYKRAFFIDWRLADRHKLPLLERCDLLLDSNLADDPRMVTGEALRAGLAQAASRPFRVVPFFDPAPWGGQWMRRVLDVPTTAANLGWCFDGVPEENSLLLGFAGGRIEIPSLDLVLRHPRALLGDAVHGRFGSEFPIRFDFLDTVGGGNLSLQVHPLTEYIQRHFAMHYTQDESYYMLDTEPGAQVFLGLREGVDAAEFAVRLREAKAGGRPFPAEQFVQAWPARTHDHFLIPAGTVHCSGAGAMVLEISATPYIFTFKLWDWGRLGLDGRPRPVHLDHGLANVQFDRTTAWTGAELVNRVEPAGAGAGWRAERTGLHQREFIDTVRHWFTATVPLDTGGIAQGGVRVCNLIAGPEAVLESPTGAFAPFVVHYAETVIIPASCGSYTIRPHGCGVGSELGLITASIRSWEAEKKRVCH
jgi:mannose-6-phosphate isomerase class I